MGKKKTTNSTNSAYEKYSKKYGVTGNYSAAETAEKKKTANTAYEKYSLKYGSGKTTQKTTQPTMTYNEYKSAVKSNVQEALKDRNKQAGYSYDTDYYNRFGEDGSGNSPLYELAKERAREAEKEKAAEMINFKNVAYGLTKQPYSNSSSNDDPANWDFNNYDATMYPLHSEGYTAENTQEAMDTAEDALRENRSKVNKIGGSQSKRYAKASELNEEYKDLSADFNAAKNLHEDTLKEENAYLKNEEGYRDANLWDLTGKSVYKGLLNSLSGSAAYNQGVLNNPDYKDILGHNYEYYNDKLNGDEFRYTTDSTLGEAVSGAAELGGQGLYQKLNPRAQASAWAAVGAALIAGQLGPQVATPEEAVTLPAAYFTGLNAASAVSNFEVEAGQAYEEMIGAGVSEDTARKVATAVGGVNGILEYMQADEIAKSLNVLGMGSGTKGIAKKLAQEIIDRGLDIGNETLQEALQELTTITGVNYAANKDLGAPLYNEHEVGRRLAETIGSSALSFGLSNAVTGGINAVTGGVQTGLDKYRNNQKIGAASEIKTADDIKAIRDAIDLSEGSYTQDGVLNKNAYNSAVKLASLCDSLIEKLNAGKALTDTDKGKLEQGKVDLMTTVSNEMGTLPEYNPNPAQAPDTEKGTVTAQPTTQQTTQENIDTAEMQVPNTDPLMKLAEEKAADEIADQEKADNALRQQIHEEVLAEQAQQSARAAATADILGTGKTASQATNTTKSTVNATSTVYNNEVKNKENTSVEEALYGKEATNGESSSGEGRQISLAGYSRLTESQQRKYREQIQRRAEIRNLSKTDATTKRSGEIISNGTDSPVRVATTEYIRKNKSLAKIAADNAAQGIKTTFTFDDITVNDGDGDFKVRAFITENGKHIIINVNNSIYTAEQLNAHERFHREIAKNPSLMNTIRGKLKSYSEAQIEKIADQYEVFYSFMDDTDAVLEEIYCDVYADMVLPENTFVHEDVSKAVTEAVEENKASAKETRGPPKASRSKLVSDIEGQLSFNFDNQTEEQREMSAEAIADLKGIETAFGNVKTISKAINITDEFLQRGSISLVGHKAVTAKDLAVLAQVYRDPRFETMHYFFTNSDGKVVYQTGVSSNMPAAAMTYPVKEGNNRFISRIFHAAKKAGAVSVYVEHNHPSGSITPSNEDISFTKRFDTTCDDYGMTFKGHVIIDHNEYSYITRFGKTSQEKINVGNSLEGIFDDSQPYVNQHIGSADSLATVASTIRNANQTEKGLSTIIFTNTHYGVNSVQEATNDFVTSEKFFEHMDNMTGYFGASGTFVATSDKDTYIKLQQMVREKLIMDALFINSKNGTYLDAAETLGRAGNLNEVSHIGGSEESKEVKPTIKLTKELQDKILKKGANALTNGAVTKYSRSTWNETDKETLAEDLVHAGHDESDVNRWINDVNSVSAIIEKNKGLDYESGTGKWLKNNADTTKSLDGSFLCTKKSLYQGTWDEIIRRLPNLKVTKEMYLELKNDLISRGYEFPCTYCYNESRTDQIGEFADGFIKAYPKYKVNTYDLTTSKGLQILEKEKPEAYAAWEDFRKKFKGSQASLKIGPQDVYYRRDIMNMSAEDRRHINYDDGLRWYAFADFKTHQMIDGMQAVMDLSAMNMMSYAYTKQPDYVRVFGDTGILINMSVAGEAKDGKLVFKNVDGMDFNTAMDLRNSHSNTAGITVVGVNDESILLEMADNRIDQIIPFHRSGMTNEDMKTMGIDYYTDYQSKGDQIEHWTSDGKRANELLIRDYWKTNLTGQENAERYLWECKRTGRIPKFERFLTKDGGKYKLNNDTEGYWKLLPNHKMYNNEGKGIEQQVVTPEFNMEAAKEILENYDGDANELPIAQDVVDDFVKKWKGNGKASRDAEFTPVSVDEEASRNYQTLLDSSPELRAAAEKLSKALKFADYLVDTKQTKALAKQLVTEFGSKAKVKEITDDLRNFYQYIHDQEKIDGEEVTKLSMAIAEKLMDDSRITYDENDVKQYKDFKQTLKKYRVNITQDVINAFGDKQSFLDFRKHNMGTITFVKQGGTDIDVLYNDLRGEGYDYFLPESLNQEDEMRNIADALQTMKPTPILEGEDYYNYVVDVSNRIFDAYFDTAFNPKANGADVRNYIREYNTAVNEFKKKSEIELQSAIRELNAEKARYKELEKENTENMIAFYNAENDKMAEAKVDIMNSAQRRVMAERNRANARIKEARAYNDKVSLKKTITSDVKEMAKWLTNPTDAKHVPETLRKPLADFLENIDYSSSRTLPDGTETKRTMAWMQMRNALSAIENRDGVYESTDGTTKFITVDPDIVAKMESLTDAVTGNPKLDNMTADQLRDLRNVIKSMKKAVQDSNKLMASERGATVDEVNGKSISELSAMRKRKELEGKTGWMHNILTNKMLSADTRFHTFGPAAEEIYHAVRKGFDRKIQHTREAVEYFNELKKTTGVKNKDINKWSDDKITYKRGNEEFTLTVAQAMSLYELWKRPQAVKHITNGGIVANTTNRKGPVKEKTQSKLANITKADFEGITNQLTDQQKQFADGVAKFFRTTAKWGNNASMLMYGYSKYNDQNYYPIKVDSTELHTNSEGQVKGEQVSIKNAGFTKATTPEAKNPILLQDIIDVFTDQVNGMSNYDGFLAPLSDMLKWYNYKGKDGKTIKKAIELEYGANADRYIHKFIEDINGQQKTEGYFANNMVGAFKGAAVGANLSVMIQQPTSIARALAVMNPKYLVQGLNAFKKATVGDYDNICKYSGIAQWKDWGFYETDIGKSMRSIVTGTGELNAVTNAKEFKEWLNNAQMSGAEVMDKVAWMAMWKASEAQVKAETDLEVGSEEYFKEVAKAFDNVIDRTQVVDSIFSRADIMRDKDSLTKMALSFMNEPMKSYNMLAWAAFDSQAAFESKNNTAIKETGKKLAAASMGFVLSNVLATAAKSLITALRNKDKDEEYLKRYKEAFKSNSDWINPATYIPYIKDIVSIFQGYDVERTDMQSWTDLYTALNRFSKTAEGTGKYSTGSNVLYALKAISSLTGIGYYNLVRDVDAIVTESLNAMDAQEELYEKEKLTGEKLSASSTYIKMALKAYSSGKYSLGDRIVEDMISVTEGTEDKTSEEKVYEKLKDKLKEDPETCEWICKNTTGKIQECALQAWKGVDKNTLKKMERKGVTVENYVDYTTGKKTPKLTDVMDKGYESSAKLYEGIGAADTNENWHHIVEQSTEFPAEQVQNTNNIVSIPSGAESVHTLVTQAYNKVYDYTEGKTLREWLKGKNFEEQWKYGVQELEKYGKIVPGSNCWMFVPNETTTSTSTEEFQDKIAAARLDGELTEQEIRDITLEMMTNGLDEVEAYELYSSEAKSNAKREEFISGGGSLEDYFKYSDSINDVKQEGKSEGLSDDAIKKEVAAEIQSYGLSEEAEKLLWGLANYAVDSTKDGQTVKDGNFDKYFK